MATEASVKADAIRRYLNDHRAGSVAGMELAKELAEENPGDEFFARLSKDIEADQDTLDRLMEMFGASGSAVKEAGAWVFEKLSVGIGDATQALSSLRKMEVLTMGIKGKSCLWESLKEISDADESLAGFNFDRLASTAESQLQELATRQRKRARKALLD